MKAADFPITLGNFLSVYLPAQRNFSKNTISSYCDTFKLLLRYAKTCGLSPERITLKQLDRQWLLSFLNWLEMERRSSVSTINQRLACLHSFFRYVLGERPELALECQKILGIVMRRTPKKPVNYLGAEDLRLILQQPDWSTKTGRRDVALLSLLYDTGARVQEIADLTVGSLRLESPAQVSLIGKGRKARSVPLMSPTVQLLKGYMTENRLDAPSTLSHSLFFNQRHDPLSRAGIAYILKKYAAKARKSHSFLPEKITPHVLRHSKAMHLLEAGVNVVYIRDILGHVNISTTETYAKANLEMKRAALEKVAHISAGNMPPWATDTGLLDWLAEYGRAIR